MENHTNAVFLPDPIEIERARRLESRANQGLRSEGFLRDSLAPFAGTSLASRAQAAYEYAKAIKYTHAGLSSAAYLAHPISVACMTLELLSPPDENATVLALLHNVFEVSSVPEQHIVERFGQSCADAIKVLTVDRTQTSRDYTIAYYHKLSQLPRWARVVKVFDKLDNLFVLGLNPDEQTRAAYLADIEAFILPMAAVDMPHLLQYLKLLIADCRKVGFIDIGTFKS